MHYYKRNIGDYYKKAGRLTMLQHGAYTMLIDSCYDREKFPTLKEALDWCWASTEDEINAVKFVLVKFFTKHDDVFKQNHISEDLAKYHENSKTNKRIAIEREAKRRDDSTKRERVVNEPPPNHKPLTTNQEPSLSSKNSFSVEHYDLADHIHKKIKELNPNANVKAPNLGKWANEIRLMQERDKRSLDEIRNIFTWANNDPFWRTNILSPAKLRKQFDQLTIKSNGENSGPHQQPNKLSLGERATAAREEYERQNND